MAAVFVVCSRQPLLRHYSRPALGAPQKRRVTIAGSPPFESKRRTLAGPSLSLSLSRAGKGGWKHFCAPSLFRVGFQPSGVSYVRTYVRVYIEGVTSSNGNVRDGRLGWEGVGGGREDWFLVLFLLFFFFSSLFFYIVLCLFSRMTGMIVHGGPEWNRFFWRARAIQRTMKRTPGKKECLPAQPTFPWQLRTLEGNVKRNRGSEPLSRSPLRTRVERAFVDRM